MPAGNHERVISELPKLNYRTWKRKAESSVVKWRWGDSWLWHPEPDQELASIVRRAVEFDDPKRRGEPGSIAEGLDQHGQVVVRHVYMMLMHEGQPQKYETFFQRKHSSLQWAQFGYYEPEKRLEQYHEMDVESDRPTIYRYCLADHGYGVKRYEYQGGRLVRMTEQRYEVDPFKEYKSVTEFAWGDAKEPDLVQLIRDDGRVQTLFSRRTRDASLRDLLERYCMTTSFR